jgi:MFS family permease
MNLFWVYAMSAVVFFARGIADLPGQAVFYWMKETLHYNEQTIMYLGSLITLAWLVKPAIGYMVDTFGISKKMWIIISVLISSLICLFIGLSPLLWVPLLIGFMMVMSFNDACANVTVDGVMCVEGKKNGITGKIQSIQWIAITAASILTGVVGGWIAEHWNYQVGYLLLIPFYMAVLLFTLHYKETKAIVVQRTSFLHTIKGLVSDKSLMIVCLFIFLYNFSPSFGTPLMFIERDKFHFSKIFIGWLGTIGSVCSVIGAWLYWHYSKKIDLNKWLFYSVFIGATTTLCYLYFTPTTCVLYDIIMSVVGMFLQLLMLDFFARKSKNGLECVTFALLTSVSNITGTLNSLVGGFLFPIVGLQWLIIVSSVTSFLCLPLLKKIRI